jgi:hypothetical protein
VRAQRGCARAKDLKAIAIALDIKNAVGTTPRKAVLCGLKVDNLAFLLPTFELLYRTAPTISFESVPAGVQGDIKVETGVVQGNVFSSLFYIVGQRRFCIRCRTPSQQFSARAWQLTRRWQAQRTTPSASLRRWRTSSLRTAWHCSCPKRRCF